MSDLRAKSRAGDRPLEQRIRFQFAVLGRGQPKSGRPTLVSMKMLVDSAEYRSWHEVGHATVCLHLGGDVDFIEFLDGDVRGYARARCVVTEEIEKSVACGGFAAEFFLLKKGYAQQSHDDERDISQVVFHNASGDREDFWERQLGKEETFTKAEDEAFMQHAIDVVAPIFSLYFSRMQQLVLELAEMRRVEGRRVKELLQLGVHHN